jgi:arginyl-tRNA synthetase
MTWIHKTLKKWLKESLNLPDSKLEKALGPCRNPKEGDLTLMAFPFAKEKGQNPKDLAKSWEKKLLEEKNRHFLIESLQALGPYLNFRLNTSALAKSLLPIVLKKKENWGHSQKQSGNKVCLDFSSPNIAKPFAIHHLRSTLIGAAIAKLLETQGYQVERINHLGDWGTQFGYVMLAWKMYHGKKDLGEHPIQTLLTLYQKIYAEAHDAAEKGDNSLHEKAAVWFKKLEENDTEARQLWEWFREVSVEALKKIYARMGIAFDVFRGEAFYEDQLEQTLKRVADKHLLEESEGAQIVRLGDDMPPVLLRKKDGATLYATRDLAALLDRWQRGPYALNLYVVATQQNLHFKQLFSLVEKLGHPSVGKNHHIPFGMLRLPDGSLGKTRKGNVIFLDEVLDTAREKALEKIEAFSNDIQNKEAVAEMIGLGAIYFNDLKAQRIKDVTFNWNDVLSFEGKTGAYLQYAQARMNRILQKGNWRPNSSFDAAVLTEPLAKDLLLLLDRYPRILEESAEKFEPNHLLNYLFELVQIYSSLTQNQEKGLRILVDDEKVKKARLALVAATRQTLINALGLLCIPCPEKM